MMNFDTINQKLSAFYFAEGILRWFSCFHILNSNINNKINIFSLKKKKPNVSDFDYVTTFRLNFRMYNRKHHGLDNKQNRKGFPWNLSFAVNKINATNEVTSIHTPNIEFEQQQRTKKNYSAYTRRKHYKHHYHISALKKKYIYIDDCCIANEGGVCYSCLRYCPPKWYTDNSILIRIRISISIPCDGDFVYLFCVFCFVRNVVRFRVTN